MNNIELLNQINLMKTFGITETELLAIELIVQATLYNDEKPLELYLSLDHRSKFDKHLFDSLKEKRIINKTLEKGASLEEIKTIIFSSSFQKKYICSTFKAAQELYDAYPLFINDDRRFPAKNLTKNYLDIESLFMAYNKKIRHSIDTHAKIMELLAFGKEQGLLNYGLVEFINSRKWNDLLTIKESNVIGLNRISNTTRV